jgi:ABC-type multidrug transport system ATPase subunit
MKGFDMELTINHLSKSFGYNRAVDDVSVTLTPGVWGLIGANGAGKTTLMRMIADIMTPTEGNIYYDGEDIHKLGEAYRNIFGLLTQEFGYPKGFTVIDYLEYMSVLKGIPRNQAKNKLENLLHVLNLSEVRKRKIAKMSGGMRRRVGIAQAMLNDPEVLILDEPTAGLDPGERIKFRNYISEFAQNRIVLISTHIVSDVEYIATQTAIMKEGRIVDVGTTDKLIKNVQGKVWTATVSKESIPEIERRTRIINQRGEANGKISIRYLSDEAWIEGSSMGIPGLEDLYMWLFPDEEVEC